MNGNGKPVLGNMPVATEILVKLWKAISVATPTQISFPFIFVTLFAKLSISKTKIP